MRIEGLGQPENLHPLQANEEEGEPRHHSRSASSTVATLGKNLSTLVISNS